MSDWAPMVKQFISIILCFGKSGTDASDPYDPTNVKATGRTVAEPGNGYVYIFTAPDTIVATGTDIADVDWLVVGSGGAGGQYYGGGGGAGGYRFVVQMQVHSKVPLPLQYHHHR